MTTSAPELDTVYVVDDDEAVRRGISHLLRAEGLHAVTFASAEEFLASGADRAGGCLLLDLRMPGMDGRALQEEIVRRGSRLGLVFLTGHGELDVGVEAMKSGAVDFLRKPARPQQLVDAVGRALERSRRACRADGELAAWRARLASLSARERDVLRLVLEGSLNKQIAAAMGISLRTAKFHRANVMSKMTVSSVAELARDAARFGFDESP